MNKLTEAERSLWISGDKISAVRAYRCRIQGVSDAKQLSMTEPPFLSDCVKAFEEETGVPLTTGQRVHAASARMLALLRDLALWFSAADETVSGSSVAFDRSGKNRPLRDLIEDLVFVAEGTHIYRGFVIQPKKDFGPNGILAVDGRLVTSGWIVTHEGANILPGATWAEGLHEAKELADAYLQAKGDVAMFWKLAKREPTMEKKG